MKVLNNEVIGQKFVMDAAGGRVKQLPECMCEQSLPHSPEAELTFEMCQVLLKYTVFKWL